MAAIILPKGNLISIWAPDPLMPQSDPNYEMRDGHEYRNLSDHNRSEVEVSSMRIEESQRMANGTLRKFWVADKKAFSVSWSMLPSYRTETVDGYWGAEDLREFYNSELGQDIFQIRLNFAKDGTQSVDGDPEDTNQHEYYFVSFTSCNFTLVKRGVNAFWNVSLSMEEV